MFSFTKNAFAAAKPKDYESIGSALMETESIGLIKIGSTDKEAAKFLGDSCEKSKPEIYGADGLMHCEWRYIKSGVTLGLVQNEKKYNICSISISKPCDLKTARGIGIGTQRKDVLKAYEQEINPEASGENSQITAGSVYGGIIFDFEKDIVSGIFIGAAAE